MRVKGHYWCELLPDGFPPGVEELGMEEAVEGEGDRRKNSTVLPIMFLVNLSLSRPTVWGIGTYIHPSRTLNMERSREEEDEQMRS